MGWTVDNGRGRGANVFPSSFATNDRCRRGQFDARRDDRLDGQKAYTLWSIIRAIAIALAIVRTELL